MVVSDRNQATSQVEVWQPPVPWASAEIASPVADIQLQCLSCLVTRAGGPALGCIIWTYHFTRHK